MIARRQLSAIAVTLLVSLLVVVSADAARGRKPGGGGGGSCAQSAPGAAVQNTYGWSQWGSFGLPGQQLAYLITVVNYDVSCSSSSFVVSLTAPSGFAVSIPTNTISLSSSATGYVWAYVTSPSDIPDGDYPLTATVTRAGGSGAGSTGSFVSYYKVYSSDDVEPTLFWASPGDGMTITGRSYNVSVSSRDDHAVEKIDLYIDDEYRSTTVCDGVAYTCSLNYAWSLGGVRGQHTVTFKSYDWLGNVGVTTVHFTVD
jgi:hypothetical protein